MSDDEEAMPSLSAVVPDEKKRQVDKLQNDINTTNAEVRQLKEKLAARKRRAVALKTEIDLFESGIKQSTFYLEKTRGGRMSIWWLIMVVVTLFCTFGTFSTKSYILSVVNFLGFLVVWRKLYVDSTSIPMVVAAVIVAVTIKFF